jgi:hypothetical protein
MMKESEYVLVSDLAKVRCVNALLRQIIGHGTGIQDELREVASTMSKIEERLAAKVKTDTRGE